MSGLRALDPTQAAEPLLRVRDLWIASRFEGRERTITSGIDLDLARGETLGIVGESGSGKSLTARALVGLLPQGVHARGEVRWRGRDLLTCRERELSRVRGAEIALIFQDPFTMLNPLMRCGRQIVGLLRDERGRALGRRAARAEAQRRLAEVGIDDPAVVDAYPFELSGGMRQRVGIAAALARDPDVVIADEPSTALDVTTQREILSRLTELKRSRGLSLILITHDLRVAFSMCDRIAVLYAGSVLESAPAEAIEQRPLHPYALGLLLSEPRGDRRVERLAAIGGAVPRPDEIGSACLFAPRCAWSQPVCRTTRPPLLEAAPGRLTACVRHEEIADAMAAARAESERRAPAAVVVRVREPLVAVRELSMRFGGASAGARTVEALKRVSLEVGADESVGLVGESGSGKTTLGRCLLGLERPTSGTIAIDGVDASDFATLSGRELEHVRRTVQMVFQDPYSTLNPVRTVRATLAEALTTRDPRARDVRGRVTALLDRVGLSADYAERKPVALSGGERQRVALARALASDPRLIVCDEPVSALDVSVQAQILNLLAELRRELGVSYLFVTHDLAVVRQIAERIYVMRRGEIVESGPADALLNDPQNAYTRALVAAMPRRDEAWLDPRAASAPAADA